MKSYLTFLFRNKLYTLIEALGLIISLAFVIIIGSYVAQQLSAIYDNPNHNRIYALGDEYRMGSSYLDKGFLEGRVPEIDAITRICKDFHYTVHLAQDTDYHFNAFEVDKEFFDIFPQYVLTKGTVEHFGEEKNIVVSQSVAALLKEDGDVLGQTIVIDDKEYVICGVFKDVHNSLLLDCDILIPYDGEPKWWFAVRDDRPFWDSGTLTIIQRKKETDEKKFKEKVFEVLQERNELSRDHKGHCVGTSEHSKGIIYSDERQINNIYNYKEMFFREAYSSFMHKSNLSNFRVLLTLMIALLMISVLNYVNLNMALTGKRAKEMATRQLLGASKSSIIGKYIMESVLFTAICFVLAFLLAYTLVPTVNNLLADPSSDQEILIQLLMEPSYILAYITGVLLLGALAGLLPALLASRYRPIETVQGTFRQHRKLRYNKIFIVVQCIFAIILMSVAFVMEVQMLHMKNREMHCQTQDLLYTPTIFAKHIKINDKVSYEPALNHLLLEELKKLPCVEDFGYVDGYPGYAFQTITTKNIYGKPITIRYIWCDSSAFRLLGFEIVKDFGCQGGGVWLGEKAFEEGGWSDTSLFAWSDYYQQSIAGVVRDFPCYGAAESNDKYNGNVMVRIFGKHQKLLVKTVGDHEEAKKQILDFLKNRYDLDEFEEMGYIDDLNLQELEPTKRTMRLLEIFMGLSVMLSFLGLVAISTYYSDESRTGIATRKVFGSTFNMELWRSVKDYMILVGIAALISTPVAYWLCDRYLSQFAYHINHFVWIIAVAVIVAMLMAFISVFWQCMRAARINPAEVLKKE